MTHSPVTARRRTFQLELLEDRSLLSTLVSAQTSSLANQISVKGSLKGNAFITIQGVMNGQEIVSVQITGTGKLSNLGKSQIQSHHTVAVNLSTGSSTIMGGTGTIRAANGAQVFLDYSGTGTPNGIGGFDDTFNIQFDGGTRAFKHATGSAVLRATDLAMIPPTDFPFVGNLKGHISFASSAKKG